MGSEMCIRDRLGCGDFVVAKLLDDENLNISLNVSGGGRENLNITNEVQTFLLPNENFNVVIQIWDTPVNDNFCSDIAPAIDPVLISTWSVVSGSAEVSASNIPDDSYSTEYNITISLENVVFEDDNEDQRAITDLILRQVNVGYFAG